MVFFPSCLDRSLALLGRTSEKRWNALLSALDQELLCLCKVYYWSCEHGSRGSKEVSWVSLLLSTAL